MAIKITTLEQLDEAGRSLRQGLHDALTTPKTPMTHEEFANNLQQAREKIMLAFQEGHAFKDDVGRIWQPLEGGGYSWSESSAITKEDRDHVIEASIQVRMGTYGWEVHFDVVSYLEHRWDGHREWRTHHTYTFKTMQQDLSLSLFNRQIPNVLSNLTYNPEERAGDIIRFFREPL